MKFKKDEELLIANCIEKYKDELNLKEFEKTKDNLVMVLKLGHDKYNLVTDVPQHKIMNSILKKIDDDYETPEEKVVREDKELKEKQKEVKKKLKEDIKKRHEEELEQELETLGLTEETENPPTEPEPPRVDVTTSVPIGNIRETLDEKNRPEEQPAPEDDGMPDLNYQNLKANTVKQLKELADYLKIEYEPTILKDDLINAIKSVL